MLLTKTSPPDNLASALASGIEFPLAALFAVAGVMETLMLWASLPCASSAYILAVRMGGDGPAVATQVTAGTLIAMVTIPLWMMTVT